MLFWTRLGVYAEGFRRLRNEEYTGRDHVPAFGVHFKMQFFLFGFVWLYKSEIFQEDNMPLWDIVSKQFGNPSGILGMLADGLCRPESRTWKG
jgi:hypothetical protein